MRFTNRKTVVILTLIAGFAFASMARAEEGEKTAKKQAPSSSQEVTKLTTKLNALSVKIQDAQKEFEELVAKKDAETDPEKLSAVLAEMVKVSERRNQDVDEYTQVRQELLYRFPSMGETVNRRYQTQQRKNVKELEANVGIEQLLTRTREIIDEKFAPFQPPKEKALTEARKRSEAQKPKKIILEK